MAPLIRAGACNPAIPICVEGLTGYVTTVGREFQQPERTGRRGRPSLVREGGVLLGQVAKRYTGRRVATVVRVTAEATGAVLVATVTGTRITTASVNG